VAQAGDDIYTASVEMGLDYFRAQAADQLPLVQTLLSVLQEGDLDAAKMAYIAARPPYERIEVLAGSFEQEDSDIDARPYAFDEGEASPEFVGFHRIEALLFRDGDVTAAVPYAEGLIASVESLIDQLNTPANFSAALNFEGIIALATEVPAKKISSEEETWSDQSLLIFQNNWIGIYSQVKPFESFLGADVMAEIDAAYAACMASIEPFYVDDSSVPAPYSTVTMAQRKLISDAGYQLRDAVVRAAESLGLAEAGV
jgi:iron uptake system component EfeO